MGRVRPTNKRYNISAHRFYELYHFCLQYNEWRDELKYKTDTVGSPEISDMPVTFGNGDSTQQLAMRRIMLAENCKLIERTAKEADPEIYPYILKAVTNEGVTYPYLQTVMNIPCSRNTYYDRRKKFYWLLSRKKIK